jgi:mRNA interferase HicA
MKSSELLRILKRDGWYTISQRGSHIKLVHLQKKNIVYFPYHGSKEMPKGIARKILKDAELL